MARPVHGQGRGGSQESVSGLTREHILDYVRQQYTPCNAVVSVAGDISHQEVLDLLGDALEGWEPATPMQWQPVVDGQTSPRVRVEQRKTDQAHLIVGLPSLPMGHPDRYALG